MVIHPWIHRDWSQEQCLGGAPRQEEERGNEPVRDAEDVQSGRGASGCIESSIQEPKLLREAATSRHQTILGQTTTIRPSPPQLSLKLLLERLQSPSGKTTKLSLQFYRAPQCFPRGSPPTISSKHFLPLLHKTATQGLSSKKEATFLSSPSNVLF